MIKICAFLAAFFLLSCASADSGKVNSSSPNENGTIIKSKNYASPSMQEQLDAGRWFSGMQDGVFVIIGVSNRRERPADEITAAKEDAARKASMYHGLQGSLVSSNTSGLAYFDYTSNSTLNLNYNANYEQYMELLSYNPDKDVIRGAGATYIRFVYNISGPGVVYLPEKSAGRPAWTYNRNLPQFPDFTTGIGYAGRRIWMRDTINASYDSAAARLIETASSQVTTGTNTQDGQGSSISINIQSEGSLTNFHIIETWIDMASGAVYTLAAARITQ